MTSRYHNGSGRAARWSACILALTIGVTAVGCDSLIDVDNPNNVSAEDLLDPVAAPSIANGALYTVQYGAFSMMAPHSTAADVGRAATQAEVSELILTHISNPFHHDTQPLVDEAGDLYSGPISVASDLSQFAVETG